MNDEERRRNLVELLSNPLDQQDPEPWDWHAPSWLLPALGVLGGAAVVLAGFALGRSSPESATPVTALSSATTTAPEATAPVEEPFPPGFTQVDELTSVRPAAAIAHGESLFVTVTTAVRRGFDPALSTAFQGGDWRLVLADGRTVDSIGQQADPFGGSPITAVFPVEGYEVEDVHEMVLVSRWVQSFHSAEQDLGDISFPYSSAEPRTVTFDEGTTIVADPVQLGAEGGTVGWELQGPPSSRAVVSVFVQLEEGSVSPNPPVMVPLLSPFHFTSLVNDGGDSTGTITLVAPVLEDPRSVVGGTVSWEVTLTTAIPGDVPIPFDP